MSDRLDESDEIIEMVFDDVPHNRQIHAGVAVHEHIAKASCIRESLSQGGVEPSVPGQQNEQGLVRLRFAETLVRDDVRRNVDDGLYRKLERVLYETLLAHVVCDAFWLREGLQVADVGLDEGEAFRDQVGVRQALLRSIFR